MNASRRKKKYINLFLHYGVYASRKSYERMQEYVELLHRFEPPGP